MVREKVTHFALSYIYVGTRNQIQASRIVL